MWRNFMVEYQRHFKTVLGVILLLVLALPITLEAKGRVYLVAVGISDYPGTKNDLRLPAEDARRIEWIYRKNGGSTKILLNGQATEKEILKAMREQFNRANPDDIILLFFSGHGYEGGFVSHDEFVDYGKIRQAMATSKARTKLIFADACFAGQMRGQGKESPSSFKDRNVLLFLSSRSNEVSQESQYMKNGFFTSALQRALRGDADTNRDRIITARELFDYVSKDVRKLTHDKQHPVMWGNFDNNLTIISW